MSDCIRLGEKGNLVITLQQFLIKVGYDVGPVDGDFGKRTERAVRAYQRDNNLLVDGIVGERCWAAIRGQPRDLKQLSNDAVEKAAARLNVEPAVIYAFSEVESSGYGFQPSGNPKVLFERHIMYRQLKRRGLSLLIDMAIQNYPNLVNMNSGGYLGGDEEWSRLMTAAKVHKRAAYESASYGRYQIMGFHWKDLGYKSVSDFVKHVSDNEDNQLDALVRFVLKKPSILNAMRDKDWVKLAMFYNGPMYHKNKYDVKLEAAYERLSS